MGFDPKIPCRLGESRLGKGSELRGADPANAAVEPPESPDNTQDYLGACLLIEDHEPEVGQLVERKSPSRGQLPGEQPGDPSKGKQEKDRIGLRQVELTNVSVNPIRGSSHERLVVFDHVVSRHPPIDKHDADKPS